MIILSVPYKTENYEKVKISSGYVLCYFLYDESVVCA